MQTLPARLKPTNNLLKWKILYLPHTWIGYSSSGILLYTELGPHSWKVQGNICPLESSCSIFTSHQIEDMIYMPDEIILARMMTALDLGFEKAMHFHDERYDSDNDCGLPP